MSTTTIFSLSTPWKCQDVYHPGTESPTHGILKQHFATGSSSKYDEKLSKIMATDIDTLHTPASQNMLDIWHNSKQPWPRFIENTSLCHLREDNIKIFSALQDYQHLFTQKIYAPLSQYLSSNHGSFKGAADDIVLNLYQVYDHLKLRKTAPNCCMQVDVRFTPTLQSSQTPSPSASISQINQNIFGDHEDSDAADVDDDDDDEDQDYASLCKMVENASLCKMNNFQPQKPASNIAKQAKIEEDDVARKSIDKIMRERMAPLDEKPYTYKRHEMLFNLKDNTVKTFEAISNTKIPDCSYHNGPACRIFNSTNASPEILHYLNPTESQKHLLTFSYHVLNDCIQLYAYIVANGKLFGSRIFQDDLLETIPLLFQNHDIHKHTKDELDGDLEFNPDTINEENKLVFLKDKIYEENKLELFKRNKKDLDIKLQLKDSIHSWNSRNRTIRQIHLESIINIFSKNNITYRYFENDNNRELFVKLLRNKKVPKSAAKQLWSDFGGREPINIDCNASVSSLSSQSILDVNVQYGSSLQQQMQIQYLQQIIKQKDDLITSLRKGDESDIDKQNDCNHMCYDEYFVNNSHCKNDENDADDQVSISSLQTGSAMSLPTDFNEDNKSDISDEEKVDLYQVNRQQSKPELMKNVDNESDGDIFNDDEDDNNLQPNNEAMINPFNLPSILTMPNSGNNQSYQYAQFDTSISNKGSIFIIPSEQRVSDEIQQLIQNPQHLRTIINIYWLCYMYLIIKRILRIP